MVKPVLQDGIDEIPFISILHSGRLRKDCLPWSAASPQEKDNGNKADITTVFFHNAVY
jgi:hypothetical protein